jgi:hypothetical protein
LVTCLTPLRDEAWILESFLTAASLWADRIIVADQGSTDASREIAASFEKVVLVNNPDQHFDEAARQQLLIANARRLADGPQILFALDADEALSANVFEGANWEQILAAPPGTALRFPWANLAPGGLRAWIPEGMRLWGYVDDGAPHVGRRIHSSRLPDDADRPSLLLDGAVVLHRQYLDWERMKAKQRWYQAWERVNDPQRSALDIYRQYHHMDAIPPEQFTDIRDEWLTAYRRAGIDLTAVHSDGGARFDDRVLDLLSDHGPKRFARIDLWDLDWDERAATLGRPAPHGRFADPRQPWDRAVERWLRATQRHSRTSAAIYVPDAVLRRLGW